MPKQKKQPKTAIYFFMADRKKQLEREGHRFPGGINDVFQACCPEWKALPKEAKAKYEVMAKEEKEKEKFNLHNKFTCTGETYAQVQARVEREKEKADRLNGLIEKLACDDTNGRRPQDRMYILIKCLNSVEEMQSNGEGKVYWPSEIALAAFSLSKGFKSVHWTLVDTVNHPRGYASDAKDSSQEYGIPMPGSEQFEEQYREYDKIFEKIQKFTETVLQDYDRDEDFTFFCLPGEIEPARQSLNWLIQNMKGQDYEAKQFWSNLEFCDLSKLMVKMAEYGKKINPSYESQLADFKLELAACNILKIGSYDYKSEITCPHHRQGEAAQKMNWCCKNVVMRRVFLIFKEFLSQYNIEQTPRHDIEMLPKIRPPQASTKTCASSMRSSPPKSSYDEDRKPGSGSYSGSVKHTAKKCKSDSDEASSSQQWYPSPNTSVFDSGDGEHQDNASFYWKDDYSQ